MAQVASSGTGREPSSHPRFEPNSSCSAGGSCHCSAPAALPTTSCLQDRLGPALSPGSQADVPTLPWQGEGWESQEGAGSIPSVVTVLVWVKSAAGLPLLEPWDAKPSWHRDNLQRMEACLLWSSEILCALHSPAWGMGLSGANCASCEERACPLSLSPLLGAGTFPFLLSHPRKLCHPFALLLEGAEEISPKSTAGGSQCPQVKLFLPESQELPESIGNSRCWLPNP